MIGCVLRFANTPSSMPDDWDVDGLKDGGVNIFIPGTEDVEFAAADSRVQEFLLTYAHQLQVAAAGQTGELDFGVLMPDAPMKSALLSPNLCRLAGERGLQVRISMYCVDEESE